MLRLTIISAAIPLALAGGVAQDWSSAAGGQCFSSDIPQATRTIAFTDDPARATVRVQIVRSPELADLAIAEDNTASDGDGCGIRGAMRSITITARPIPGEPVVYLSREADADYRIYVDSAQVSAQQAAALIVSARGGQTRLAASPVADEVTGSIGR